MSSRVFSFGEFVLLQQDLSLQLKIVILFQGLIVLPLRDPSLQLKIVFPFKGALPLCIPAEDAVWRPQTPAKVLRVSLLVGFQAPARHRC